MKFIIIGLGHFGSALAEKLTNIGHQVVAVDSNMRLVELIKDRVTHAVCLNCKDTLAIKNLPLENTDVAIVCIGSDEGENLMTTALLKKMNVKRIISRSVSPLQENILEAMGINEIIRPEIETAERWALKLSATAYVDLFEVTKDFNIVEMHVPRRLIGKSLKEIEFNKKYNVIVLTKLKQINVINKLGVPTTVLKTGDIITAESILNQDDVIVVYGHRKDIQRLIESNEN
ncbi:MAG: TrkA family potassium uptake protein [Proteiniphilum sp.]|nr:TrkA family potassium uptake protein [Proteiniphilum sp.]MDD3909068.1 TrkA family potassium uptake protein [Proteiniphilum sp.]MDD4416585.1 TrkA family potassium uptake protein [Proteiniphilum sp.]